MHPAHVTFDGKTDADAWLATIRTDIARERFVCPIERRAAEEAARLAGQTFHDYSEAWLASRRRTDGRSLRERTRLLYGRIIGRDLLPTFGTTPLDQITSRQVRDWWQALPDDRLTGNAHAYSLLRTILGTAVESDLLPANPARVKGAGQTTRRRKVEPATVPELEAIAAGMPDPYRMAVLLAGWCALRFGEVVELRHRDVTVDGATLRVRRAMTARDGQVWVGSPKSVAGSRDVSVPPHLREILRSHQEAHAQPGRDGLLFSAVQKPGRPCKCGYDGCQGGHLMGTSMYRWFDLARTAAGRPDLRFHDLRHTGLTLAAHAGATLPDLMARAGHTSVAAAQVYMHAARGRDDEIAIRMSELLGNYGPQELRER